MFYLQVYNHTNHHTHNQQDNKQHARPPPLTTVHLYNTMIPIKLSSMKQPPVQWRPNLQGKCHSWFHFCLAVRFTPPPPPYM